MKDGANVWGAVANSDLDFDFLSGEDDWAEFTYPFQCYDSNGDNLRPYEKNGIHEYNLVGLGPAVTIMCLAPNGGIHDFQIHFDCCDSRYSWWNSTNDPGTDQLDRWSVAAHEFGHAGGWGPHFQEGPSPAADCEGSPASRQTMCGGTPEYWNQGHKWQRTLENHDIHELQAAY